MEKTMPQYTIKNKQTDEEIDVVCSWDELQEALAEDSNLVQKLSTPKIVGGVGGTLSKAGSNWQDLMGRIKKSSGRNNTIKT